MKLYEEIFSTWEKGSTNVFSDLVHADATEKLAKVELAYKINQLIRQRGLKQKEAAQLLETDQAKISALSRGHLSIFSLERLLKYLTLLDQDVEIVIKAKNTPASHGKLCISYA